jgi:phosphoenolpyruvate-protein phosphotransferase (PTS system enzyme I)
LKTASATMAERRLKGRPASSGWAQGPVFVLDPATGEARVPTGDPDLERQALEGAIARARAETEQLIGRAESDAADMLTFQLAMLEDPELAAPSLSAIAGGAAADLAWTETLNAEIAGYEAANDPYFRARSADLRDIRDRVFAHLCPGWNGSPVPPGAVIVASDLPLSRFLAVDWLKGGAIVLTEGSSTSHVAMLARARSVPMVVGLGGAPEALAGHEALVDAAAGEVVIDPQDVSRTDFAARSEAAARLAREAAVLIAHSAHTADGVCINTYLNIVGPDELNALDPAVCDGIGLYRTEFLFSGGIPDEDTQYTAYRPALEWAGGRSVTIRTLDAGGDKPIPGVTLQGESNPFLGLRGVRLSLRHPGLFRVQLRALLRAGRHGRLRIMLPMVTVPEELEAARALLQEEIADFARAGTPVPEPELGIMVEVPAAALSICRFDAAFFSIGSNDLTQYLTAAGRDSAAVADLADPLNPAVLDTIANVARHGREAGRDVSVCGDAAGEPVVIPALLCAGIRSLSVASSSLAACKLAIASTRVR